VKAIHQPLSVTAFRHFKENGRFGHTNGECSCTVYDRGYALPSILVLTGAFHHVARFR